MSDELRNRYRALLRWYPTDYRTERGDEIVETYLDLAAPGQRRPHPSDVVDLIRGCVRAHLRARHSLGLADALPIAANLALMTATVLAALWLVLAERTTVPGDFLWHSPGPFVTLGAAAWIAWLLTPAAALLGFGRPAVALALLTTAALVPVATLTSYVRPPLFVLVPQIALGMVALAVPARRWSPVSGVGLAVTAATAGLAARSGVAKFYYTLLATLPYAGLCLAAVSVITAIVLGVRRDPRGWWAALILLGPVLLLATTHRSLAIDQQWSTWSLAPAATWWTGAATTAVVTAIAVAAVCATLWLRGWLVSYPAHGSPTRD
ncbi:hypothetical protein [Rugosimonospora africana]|uniref:Uncharacterized protein n=1 Tax=Rugosimonospora africana TaxID=556532 RepID=A0A8J3QW21_9ACTN|nr:hypothetical protein [Rugosimonospora africana]GIH16853.1 hypothetical protein Raf01_50250 [Rugosimonospora africana]